MYASTHIRGKAVTRGCSNCEGRRQNFMTLSETVRGRAGGSVRAQQFASVGEIDVTAFEVRPNPVLPDPDGQVTISVELAERASFVGVNDPDLCNPGGVSPTGLQVLVECVPDWFAEKSKTVCVPMYNSVTGRAVVQFSFPAPSLPAGVTEEQHEVILYVSLPGSDQGPDDVSKTLVVNTETGKTGCSSNSDCQTGLDCQLGECAEPGTIPDLGDGGGDGGGGGGGGVFPGVGELSGLLLLVIVLIIVLQVSG